MRAITPVRDDSVTVRVFVITAVVPDPRRAERVSVQVEDSRAVVVPLDVAERMRLRVGRALSEFEREKLEFEVAACATLDRALRMLTARSRASRELRRLLVRKGEAEQHVDSALQRLERMGLLDDASFARQFVRSRVGSAGFAERRLQAELARRGVHRDIADTAIAEVMAEEQVDPGESLERLARRKLGGMTGLDPDVRRRRVFAYLARRGYGGGEIAKVVSRLLEAQDEVGEIEDEDAARWSDAGD